MSLYNHVNGFNANWFFLLPMLDLHPDQIPRFRDCFLSDDKQHIDVYTRVGGNNRNCGYGEEKLYQHPNFVKTWDDEFDNTYASYQFSIPEKWMNDFTKIRIRRVPDISDEYFEQICKIFPHLKDKLTKYLKEYDTLNFLTYFENV